MRRELVDQSIQATLLIQVGSIVLHGTIEHSTKGVTIVRTITGQNKGNVCKDNKAAFRYNNNGILVPYYCLNRKLYSVQAIMCSVTIV
jgi:hypothetical protein